MLDISPTAKVLVIEDDPLVAFDLVEELEASGFSDVAHADNVCDALRAINDRLPDVAVVDLRLKDGETGAQLAAALARSGVRVCVLSGSYSDRLAQLPHIYLAKPVPAHVVARVVGGQANLATGFHATSRH